MWAGKLWSVPYKEGVYVVSISRLPFFPVIPLKDLVGGHRTRVSFLTHPLPFFCFPDSFCLKQLLIDQSWTANLTDAVEKCALDTSSSTTESAIETLLSTEN